VTLIREENIPEPPAKVLFHGGFLPVGLTAFLHFTPGNGKINRFLTAAAAGTQG
jgi:hypothetical protein